MKLEECLHTCSKWQKKVADTFDLPFWQFSFQAKQQTSLFVGLALQNCLSGSYGIIFAAK